MPNIISTQAWHLNYAAEDLMEDAAHHVKRDPLRSVVLGFAIGLGMGALAVWMATSNARE